MPNGLEDTPRASRDKWRLIHFLLWVQRFLDELVRGDHGRVFYREMEEPLRSAWEEGRHHFRTLALQVLFVARDDDLRYHGLSGMQLDLKLKAVGFFLGKLKSSFALRWLAKTLECVDVLLRSLIEAIPGASGAAGELKDMMEKLLDDDSDDEADVTFPEVEIDADQPIDIEGEFG